MRHPRIKPREDTFVHVYNRCVGTAGEFPFGPAEKEEFISRLKRLCGLYVIEPIAFQVMGNHYHAVLFVPGERPSNKEAAERHRRYYGLKRAIPVNSARCTALAKKLRDMSEFMRELQQPYTRWFNRTRPRRRRGHLWANRFKNTVLENGLAVWDCWLYVEMNPVRARMVGKPADYRFCSFGAWSATGKHPFAEAVEKRAMPWLKGLLHVEDLKGLRAVMRKEFARATAVERKQTEEQIETAIAVAAEKEPFVTQLDRRVRYWVDGLVIGSDLFVRDTLAKYRTALKLKKRRFVRALRPDRQPEPALCCFKQLRVLTE